MRLNKYINRLRPGLAINTVVFVVMSILTSNVYAQCSAKVVDNDFNPDAVYLKEGALSLADIYSPDQLTQMAAWMQTVTCDTSPVYVAIKGSATAYYSIGDVVFKYNRIEESYGIGALINTIAVTIKGTGQAPGAKLFDIYVADEELKTADDGWKGVHIISARAAKVVTGWEAAICSLDVPTTITLPDSAPGNVVTANLPVKIKCNKKPNSFLSYRIEPQSDSFDLVNGVIYNKNEINISLSKEGVPFDMSHLVYGSFGDDFTVNDVFSIKSEIGKGAKSGKYETDLTVWLYHN